MALPADLYRKIASTIIRDDAESELHRHLTVTGEYVATRTYIHCEMYIEHTLMPLLQHYTSQSTTDLIRRHLHVSYQHLSTCYKTYIGRLPTSGIYSTIAAMCNFVARQHVTCAKIVGTIDKLVARNIHNHDDNAMSYRELLVDFLCAFGDRTCTTVFATVTPRSMSTVL